MAASCNDLHCHVAVLFDTVALKKSGQNSERIKGEEKQNEKE